MNYRNLRILSIAAALVGLILTVALGGGQSDPSADPLRDGPGAGDHLGWTKTATGSTDDRVSLDGRNGFYTASVGTRLAFAAEIRSGCTLVSGDQSQRVHLDVDGELHIVVADRRDDEIGVIVRFASARVSAGTAQEDMASDAKRRVVENLASGIQLKMGTDGSTLGYRLPAGTNAEQQALWLCFVSALRFVAPDDATPVPGTEWSAAEMDATGTADIAYRWLDAQRLQKQKTAYHTPADDQVVPEVAGSGSARFDSDAGWLAEVDYSEALSLTLPEAEITSKVKFATHCLLNAVTRRATPIEFDWDGSWQTGCAKSDPADEGILREAIADHLEGVQASDLVKRLEAALRIDVSSAEVTEVMDLLIWLIRLDENAIAELEHMLNDPNLESQMAGTLLSALGGAGTDAAQGLLSNILGDHASSESHRVFAAQAMFQLEQPNAKACRAATRLATGTAAARGLRGTGLLLLGAYAHRDGGDDEIAGLVAFESRARSEGLLADWLAAMGNAGTPETVRAAAKYLEDSDPQIRMSAVEALRRVSGEASIVVLVRAVRDSMPLVRARAAELLAARATGKAMRQVGDLIRFDAAEMVRASALRGLARRIAEPEVRILVERAASDDASAKVRAQAAKLLGR